MHYGTCTYSVYVQYIHVHTAYWCLYMYMYISHECVIIVIIYGNVCPKCTSACTCMHGILSFGEFMHR